MEVLQQVQQLRDRIKELEAEAIKNNEKDVCKWDIKRSKKVGLKDIKTSCDIDAYRLDHWIICFKYCPFCGKPIEVEE